MKKSGILLLFVLFSLPKFAQAQSHMPSHQFGLGMFVEPGAAGLSGTYAISHDLQAGTFLSLGVGSSNGVSNPTTFLFAPFFRYVFSGAVNPFVEGNLQVQGKSVNDGDGGSVSQTNVGIGFGGGFAYGISQNFNVDFDLGLIGIGFSNGGSFSFGFDNVAVEGKWFF